MSAFATGAKLVLGQEAVAEKVNEIVAIPKLLERLDIEGALVSIDAMGCNPEIAQAILDAKADYLLVPAHLGRLGPRRCRRIAS